IPQCSILPCGAILRWPQKEIIHGKRENCSGDWRRRYADGDGSSSGIHRPAWNPIPDLARSPGRGGLFKFPRALSGTSRLHCPFRAATPSRVSSEGSAPQALTLRSSQPGAVIAGESIETAIIALGREPGGGLIVLPDASTNVHRAPIISAAARNN